MNEYEKITFYFDESFHSRKINENTIKSEEYFDNYVSVGIGMADIEKNKETIKVFENKNKKNQSKFQSKYSERIESIREADEKIKSKKAKQNKKKMVQEKRKIIDEIDKDIREKMLEELENSKLNRKSK